MRGKMSKKQKKEENRFDNPAKSSPDIKKIKAEKKPQRKAENKEKRMRRYGVLFNVLHGLLSLVFLVSMLVLNVLPLPHTFIVILVVGLLFLITAVTQKRGKAARVLGRIYSVLIMLVLLVGSAGLGAANYVLDEITGAPFEKKKQTFDLMSSDTSYSITEDSCCVYVKGTGSEAEQAEMLVVVNPETRQLLCIETPADYFVTIPKVSNGQRERLIEAREYGIEASVAALNNLYEIEISYFLEVDYEWLETLNSPQDIISGMKEIDSHIRTNLSKYEVQQLIKTEIGDKSDWVRHERVATGTKESVYTFVSPDERVSVLVPDQVAVDELIDLIDRVEDGEILKDKGNTEDKPVIVIP